jgi:anti-sigma regulatory factor (Ser/Thr protein kinase)
LWADLPLEVHSLHNPNRITRKIRAGQTFTYHLPITGADIMVDFERREHSIQADLGLLKEARDFAERAAADFGLDGSACYDVKLAMSEAVTNAIQHGSSSPNDPIRILVLAEGPRLVFEVVDTGRFVPRVTRRGGELSESGRGLEFMRVLMDEVDLRPGNDGTLMRFAKQRAA